MTANSLIAFIKLHGCRARAISGNRLVVVSIVVLANGTAIPEAQTIAATGRAVRDWLGY